MGRGRVVPNPLTQCPDEMEAAYRRLWAAVVQEAIDDLKGKPQRMSGGYWARSPEDIRRAYLFLLGTDHRWTLWRQWVCAAAGVNERAVQERAIRILRDRADREGMEG